MAYIYELAEFVMFDADATKCPCQGTGTVHTDDDQTLACPHHHPGSRWCSCCKTRFYQPPVCDPEWECLNDDHWDFWMGPE